MDEQKISDLINGITIPRLRGHRLMRDEKSISRESIREICREVEYRVYEDAVTSCPRFRPESNINEFSLETDRLEKKYLIKRSESYTNADGEVFVYSKTVGFRWNLLHGKNRKAVKLAIKHKRNKAIAQYEAFNRYVGREDVLCIHARIGGGNWYYYGGGEIEQQPWFLEKVDDCYDDTYCDIYAKIKV